MIYTTSELLEFVDYYRKRCECIEDENAFNAIRSIIQSAEPRVLSLEELRQMDGQPVWIKRGCNGWWMVVATHFQNEFNSAANRFVFTNREALHEEQYGKTWLAYTVKPKGDENDG